MKEPVHISIVMVTWFPGPEFAACVASLSQARKLCPLRLELLVVDNGSPAFPQSVLHRCWSGAVVLRNQHNRGFAAACNQAARQASGQILLLLNPDTVALGDPFTPLWEGFRRNPQAVALAPKLQDLDKGSLGNALFQLRRFPRLGQLARELLLFDELWPGNPWLARDRYLQCSRDMPFPVEQPAAAALAVRKEVFHAVGGFDEQFFPAWFEDVDFCRRLWRKGEILFWPTAVFGHHVGISRAILGFERFLPIFYRNALRYWRKHHGQWVSLGVRTLILLGMALRFFAAPFTRKGRRPLSEARRAYFATMKVALSPLPASPEKNI